MGSTIRTRLLNILAPGARDRSRMTPLKDIHVHGATLCTNRHDLLTRLPPHPATVVELGVDKGDFSEAILAATSPGKFYLVDMWNTPRYGDDKYASVQARFAEQIHAKSVQVMRSDSISAARNFQDESVDWIYIDTDHSYQTTAAELKAWAPKIKQDGMILGHDYVQGNWNGFLKYGVIEAVHEFCVRESWRLKYVTADSSENNSFCITRQ